jgi:hypothetical protein
MSEKRNYFLILMTISLIAAISLACGVSTTNSSVNPPQIQSTSQSFVSSPTSNIPQLEILSHTSYVDGNWLHIVGEVKNNSNYPMEYVKIVITLYDNNSKVVGTDFTYTELDVIPPGGKSPFESGTDEWTGTATYKLQVEGREGALGRQDLEVIDHSSYQDGDWLHVRGEVQNNGTTPAEYVKLILTLYDVNGEVIGMDFTYTMLDNIPPGGTSPFESGTDHWPNFDHYEIQIQGH